MKFEGPPQFESQPPKERSPEYVKTLAELEQVLGTSEKEQTEFIEKRFAALSQGAEVGEMSHIGLVAVFIKVFWDLKWKLDAI